jgi:RND family efflux transporter MFP subunit
MGFNLYDVFMQAGFSVEHVMTEAIVQTPTQPYPLASIIRAVMPRILAQGVASESEIDIDTLEKRLDRERQDTNATYIADMMFVAPFAGVISRKLTEAGEWVETGVPVLELVGTEHLRLDVQAPQERFVDIDLETPVSVRLDGHPKDTFRGRVSAKVPVNDPGARTFLVRVLLEDAEGRMIPGMSAEATFGIRSERSAVTVPRDALVRDADGTQRVWIVTNENGESRASARTVRLGRSLAETVEVVEGLEPDLPVIVRGNESLHEGQAVHVVVEN